MGQGQVGILNKNIYMTMNDVNHIIANEGESVEIVNNYGNGELVVKKVDCPYNQIFYIFENDVEFV